MFRAIILFVFLTAHRAQAYVPPAPLIKPFSPAGIHISIPHEAGIRLVAVHVKINEEMVGLEAGTIARDILSANDGRWTYEDHSTKLRKGDTVHYWIHVIYKNLGYNLVDQEYVVEDFYDYNGNKIEPCKHKCHSNTDNHISNTVANCQTQCYVPPVPLIEPLLPHGIRMSIPDEEGISLVAFHVKMNDEMVGLEAGTIARDIIKPIDGRWTYHDTTTKLKKGDTLHYWIHVIYKGLGYNLIEQEFKVTEFFDPKGHTTTAPTTEGTTTPKTTTTKSTTTESSDVNTTTQSNDDKTTTESSDEDSTTQSSDENNTTQSSDDSKTTISSDENTTTQSEDDDVTTSNAGAIKFANEVKAF